MLKLNNISEEYLQWIPNYKMNLVTLEDMDESKLQTGLRELIGTMKRSGSKQELLAYMHENEERFSRLDRENFDTIGVMLNQRELLRYSERNKEGGVYNMCQAIKEIREDGIAEGIAEGREEGIELVRKIFKLKAQGYAEEKIAAVCGVTKREVEKIIN